MAWAPTVQLVQRAGGAALPQLCNNRVCQEKEMPTVTGHGHGAGHWSRALVTVTGHGLVNDGSLVRLDFTKEERDSR